MVVNMQKGNAAKAYIPVILPFWQFGKLAEPANVSISQYEAAPYVLV